jgi:hypothetical protein
VSGPAQPVGAKRHASTPGTACVHTDNILNINRLNQHLSLIDVSQTTLIANFNISSHRLDVLQLDQLRKSSPHLWACHDRHLAVSQRHHYFGYSRQRQLLAKGVYSARVHNAVCEHSGIRPVARAAAEGGSLLHRHHLPAPTKTVTSNGFIEKNC